MVHTDGMSQEANDDPYRWLEDLAGDEAAGWVRDRNAHSVGTLATGTRFTELQAQLRQVLNAAVRLPFPRWSSRGSRTMSSSTGCATPPRPRPGTCSTGDRPSSVPWCGCGSPVVD